MEYSAEECHVVSMSQLVLCLKPSTCCLDIFKSAFRGTVSKILQIVNDSLLSGTFPASLNAAVKKPS